MASYHSRHVSSLDKQQCNLNVMQSTSVSTFIWSALPLNVRSAQTSSCPAPRPPSPQPFSIPHALSSIYAARRTTRASLRVDLLHRASLICGGSSGSQNGGRRVSPIVCEGELVWHWRREHEKESLFAGGSMPRPIWLPVRNSKGSWNLGDKGLVALRTTPAPACESLQPCHATGRSKRQPQTDERARHL